MTARAKRIRVCYTFYVPAQRYFCDETLLTKLRISIVQYLNTAPLVWGFTHGPLAGKYDLSFTVPSQCAEALRADEADIAIIPAIEYQRIPNLVLLPGYGHRLEKTRAEFVAGSQEADPRSTQHCAGQRFAQHSSAHQNFVCRPLAYCSSIF